MSGIPPSQQLAELARQFAEQARQGTEVEELTDALFCLGACKLIQELLEAEVAELGAWTLRCAEGRVEIDIPQVRGVEVACQPTLWQALKQRRDVLERLVVERYARAFRPGTSRTR